MSTYNTVYFIVIGSFLGVYSLLITLLWIAHISGHPGICLGLFFILMIGNLILMFSSWGLAAFTAGAVVGHFNKAFEGFIRYVIIFTFYVSFIAFVLGTGNWFVGYPEAFWVLLAGCMLLGLWNFIYGGRTWAKNITLWYIVCTMIAVLALAVTGLNSSRVEDVLTQYDASQAKEQDRSDADKLEKILAKSADDRTFNDNKFVEEMRAGTRKKSVKSGIKNIVSGVKETAKSVSSQTNQTNQQKSEEAREIGPLNTGKIQSTESKPVDLGGCPEEVENFSLKPTFGNPVEKQIPAGDYAITTEGSSDQWFNERIVRSFESDGRIMDLSGHKVWLIPNMSGLPIPNSPYGAVMMKINDKSYRTIGLGERVSFSKEQTLYFDVNMLQGEDYYRNSDNNFWTLKVHIWKCSHQ